jgi:hypothetical protein
VKIKKLEKITKKRVRKVIKPLRVKNLMMITKMRIYLIIRKMVIILFILGKCY